jgi:hypothetical protein
MGKKVKCILCGKTLHIECPGRGYSRFVCGHTDCPMRNVFLSGSAAIALDKKRREAKRRKKIDQLRKGPHA